MSATELLDQIRALPDAERDVFYRSLIEDEALREDILDSITIQSRRGEPSEPLEKVLSELRIQL